MQDVQDVYDTVPLRREAKEAGVGRGRNRTAMQAQEQTQPTLWRILDLRWPFRAVPSWEDGVRFLCPPVNQSLDAGGLGRVRDPG